MSKTHSAELRKTSTGVHDAPCVHAWLHQCIGLYLKAVVYTCIYLYVDFYGRNLVLLGGGVAVGFPIHG